jgi:hypothetical protein
MRRRAYRPEAPDCLEDRSLLSGVAGLSAHPVVVSRRQLSQTIEHIKFAFGEFTPFRVVHILRDDLHNVAKPVPFGRVDGLDATIDRIVDRMQHDLSARVPHPIRSAQHALLVVIRADVLARVRAGDVVLR